jgi:hypothetical protein
MTGLRRGPTGHCRVETSGTVAQPALVLTEPAARQHTAGPLCNGTYTAKRVAKIAVQFGFTTGATVTFGDPWRCSSTAPSAAGVGGQWCSARDSQRALAVKVAREMSIYVGPALLASSSKDRTLQSRVMR